MPHKRQTIREAIVNLVTGLATTGLRVKDGSVYPSSAEWLPGLNVTTPKDEVNPEYRSNRRRQLRTLTVAIEARVKPPAETLTPQVQMDNIEAEVQAAIMADVTLGGLVNWIAPGDSTFDLSGKLERPSGESLMVYECEYQIAW